MVRMGIINRVKIYARNAEILQIIQFINDPSYVTVKTAWQYLIPDNVFDPLRRRKDIALRDIRHKEHRHIIEYKLTLDSNPEFTASVLTACARAAWRLQQEGQSGCRTMLDLPPAYLSERSAEDLRKHLL